jgi:choline dehydrogenase-like flavoprotein
MQENIVRPIRRMFANFGDPDVVEAWISEPNKGLNNRSEIIFAGKTLGGTSAINGAQFSRPEAKVRASSSSSMPC